MNYVRNLLKSLLSLGIGSPQADKALFEVYPANTPLSATCLPCICVRKIRISPGPSGNLTVSLCFLLVHMIIRSLQFR